MTITWGRGIRQGEIKQLNTVNDIKLSIIFKKEKKKDRMKNAKQTYPKKMKAFWKNTAIPGYTMAFSIKVIVTVRGA